ncbi:hypothetical protein FIU96_12020 [Marinobacter sp. THAF39]|nr:hypothetical protein FIV08_12105 [Marinobacter sp. THAF197a]QFT51351.1 hypothetical protein FIU96_12020 [Marinobacter sp. THAF39]
MDFTFVVQDFLLECLTKNEVFNSERLGQASTWTATDRESEFIEHKEAGSPCFELGGVYFIAR